MTTNVDEREKWLEKIRRALAELKEDASVGPMSPDDPGQRLVANGRSKEK